MCVSVHIGLQNRVGRSGFFICFAIYFIIPRVRFIFKNKKIIYFCNDFRKYCLQNLITYLKVVLITSCFSI